MIAAVIVELIQLAQNPEEAAQCLPPSHEPGRAGLSSPHADAIADNHTPSDR